MISSLSMNFGLVVKWDNGGFASLNWEFDSPSVHQIGDVGKLVTPVDCKSAARKALLVQLQSSPPYTAPLAHSGEHRTVTAEARGSKPLRGASNSGHRRKHCDLSLPGRYVSYKTVG